MGDVIIKCENKFIGTADEFVDVLNDEFFIEKSLKIVILRGKVSVFLLKYEFLDTISIYSSTNTLGFFIILSILLYISFFEFFIK